VSRFRIGDIDNLPILDKKFFAGQFLDTLVQNNVYNTFLTFSRENTFSDDPLINFSLSATL
jgi:hypothetical protein